MLRGVNINNLKIAELEINSFRGIKHEIINLDSKSLLLLGENGTGKSSIVNAIEYLFTSKVSSLSGSADINHNEVLRFIGKTDKELSVKLTFSNGCFIERSENSFEYSPELSKLIPLLSNGSNIIIRKKLLKFIDSQPKQRYEAIGGLFGFDYLDKLEEIFRKTNNKIENQLLDKKAEYTNNVGNLAGILSIPDIARSKSSPKKAKKSDYSKSCNKYLECIEELNKRIAGQYPFVDENTNFEEYLRNLQDKLKSLNANGAVNVLRLIEEIGDLKTFDEELNHILCEFDRIHMDNTKESISLFNILINSKEYFVSVSTDECPLCKSPIDQNKVKDDIDNQIASFEKSRRSLESLNYEIEEFIQGNNDLINHFNLIRTHLELMDDDKIGELISYIEETKDMIFALNNQLEDLIGFKIYSKEIIKPYGKINSRLESINKFIILRYSKRGDDDDTLDILNKSILQLYNLEKIKNEIKSLDNQFSNSNKTYSLYKKGKINYIKEILGKITENVNEYYAFIHHDDEINNPKFLVSGSTGLKLRIDTFDEERDPREYSSEGHLDTLGLCIFLAFVKENSIIPIIILDDIVTTVDLSHKERVARLLTEEFEDYQLLITTHNKMWFKRLKDLARVKDWRNHVKKGEGKFLSVEITSWNLDEGPHLSNHKTDNEIIEGHLKRHDLVAAAHASRRYLEIILRNICLANETRLPFKDKPYSLLDFLNAAKKEIKYHTEDSIYEDYYFKILDDLEKSRSMANDFVHGSVESEDLSLEDAQIFSQAVYDLHDAVTCDECGSYIRFYKKNRGFCTNRNCSSSFYLR